MFVVGARPQFIKSAPVIYELTSRRNLVTLNIVHSGQHYAPEMSEIFFRELRIPEPTVNLAVGSSSHASQTSTIMSRLERPITKFRPNILVVPGDTNTTLAAALTAAKLQVPVAHLEAGLRSWDMSMPEEINRVLTDHCSSILLAPTQTAVTNLRNEGLGERVYLTGDTNLDALKRALPLIKKKTQMILGKFKLTPRHYVLVTLHRPSNVDNLKRLRLIRSELIKLSSDQAIVFPIHPRTKTQLERLELCSNSDKRLILAPPQGYIEVLALLRNASCLLTDSGGMQKEAYLLRVPCVTIRSSTEWPETLAGGANRLAENPEVACNLVAAVAMDNRLRRRLMHLSNPFGDGKASKRITKIIIQAIGKLYKKRASQTIPNES